MSYSVPFGLYPGQVFATCWQAATYLANVLASGTAAPQTVAATAQACYDTFSNGADAVAAWAGAAAMAQETINMNTIQALNLNLDSSTQQYFVARSEAISAAASGLAALPPAANPFGVSVALSAGNPAIADPKYLEWCLQFDAESQPDILLNLIFDNNGNLLFDNNGNPLTTSSPGPGGYFVTAASGAATAWQNIANAIFVLQGGAVSQAWDTAMRQYRIASGVSDNVTFVSNNTGGFLEFNTDLLWNQAVSMPSILQDIATLTSSPASLGNQQAATIRYILRTLSLQTAYFLLSLRSSATGAISTAQLRRNESLMDLAARSAGGFEEWSSIANINGLQPPYPGPTNIGVAASGLSLLMPGSTTVPSGASAPTYAANVLGIDYNFGPINGPQPSWLGDIQLIAGYPNFVRALGRRIQTPLGSLIYHNDYGSRIPPEVGAVQSATEAAKLAAFGKAALSADPRTASVISAVGSTQPGFLATFSGVILPIGPGAVPVSVNEVISPLL